MRRKGKELRRLYLQDSGALAVQRSVFVVYAKLRQCTVL